MGFTGILQGRPENIDPSIEEIRGRYQCPFFEAAQIKIALLVFNSILLPTCHAVIHEGGRHQALRCIIAYLCSSV